MTLLETIHLIEVIAANQPAVNMIVQNDIFRLNAKPDARYGAFGWTQGQHSASIDGNFMTFQFTFFYIDRLTADKSNQIEVQSVGIQTLDNILRALNDRGVYVDGYTFQPFNQRFMDECAGVFCTVSLDVPARSLCREDFADFNGDDFNDDFMIY